MAADEGAPERGPSSLTTGPLEDRSEDALYHLLVSSVRDYGIFALDTRGRIITWNPGAERLKGYRADEIIGRHFSVFYEDVDIARGKPAHELHIAGEYGRFEDEGWRLRKDGSRFWANVVITAMRDDKGQLVGYSKVTRDLTERRQDEEALRLSEERFRLLVEGVTDYAIFLLDPRGHVQSWNAGAQRLMGYRPGEIVGEHFSRFYPPEELGSGRPEAELETAQREGRFEEEDWRVRKDGSRFWANVVVRPLYHPNTRNLLGFSKVTRDLTERRLSEDTLRRAFKDMESFSYTVSHDLRAPLRAMVTIGEHLLRDRAGDVPKEVQEDLARIVSSAKRAGTLVEDLLSFARASQGDLAHEVIDITGLAHELGAEMRIRTGRDVDLVVAPKLQVKGDPKLIRIALDNLLTNAWKFTQNTPKARVEVLPGEKTEDYATIVIRDNGAGFDPRRTSELFQPFHRLHKPNEFDGSGIGLATVRRILERHGGRVWAMGRVNEGATFFFQLPEE